MGRVGGEELKLLADKSQAVYQCVGACNLSIAIRVPLIHLVSKHCVKLPGNFLNMRNSSCRITVDTLVGCSLSGLCCSSDEHDYQRQIFLLLFFFFCFVLL